MGYTRKILIRVGLLEEKYIRKGVKKFFSRNPIFGGTYVPKSRPLKDSPIAWVTDTKSKKWGGGGTGIQWPEKL